MLSKTKLTALITTAICATTFSSAAFAQTSSQTSSMEARLAALEAMVAELKTELAAERAKMDEQVILLDQKIQQPLPVAAPSGQIEKSGFQVGDTTFRIGGFVDLDTHVTRLSDGAIGSGSIARDFYYPV